LTVILEPTSDQEFFQDTTARFLDEAAPVDTIRRLRDDAVGFEDKYWQQGCDLGWTSLLVSEAHGGGSISDLGLLDLTLVAYEFGRHAAPGPLTPTNVVAAALSAAGDTHADVIADLLSGQAVATWAATEPPPDDGLQSPALEIRIDGDDVLLSGVKRPVESGARAEHLLVTGSTDGGLTQVLVPAATPGVTTSPMRSVDLTRRFSVVTFDDARVPLAAVVGEVGGAAAAVERQLQLAVVLANAEAVGAMARAFDITVEWAFDRYTFGRPLASYQALKHRLADMKMWLEASHAISEAAAVAVASGAPEARELASSAKAYVGQYGSELMHECVQLHGGIGVTFEHDLHLFLRRHTIDRTLYGTPTAHRLRIADLVEEQEGGS
jgi:alkylation response protein AidB-like acyl-CoA dehydrogenase